MLRKLGLLLMFAAALAMTGCVPNSRTAAKKRTKGGAQPVETPPVYTGPEQPSSVPAPAEPQPVPKQ